MKSDWLVVFVWVVAVGGNVLAAYFGYRSMRKYEAIFDMYLQVMNEALRTVEWQRRLIRKFYGNQET